jgi:hypothetical protein
MTVKSFGDVERRFKKLELEVGRQAERDRLLYDRITNTIGGWVFETPLVAYGVPNFTYSTSNAAGATSTLVRSDATLAIFEATVPGTILPDAAAAAGAAAFAARRDHTHAIVAAAPSSNLTYATVNAEGGSSSFSRADHAHAITNSSNPGAAASILSTNASGYLQLYGLGIGVAAGAANRITIVNGGSVGQAAGPLLTFDDSSDYLKITGCSVIIGAAASTIYKVQVEDTAATMNMHTTVNNSAASVSFSNNSVLTGLLASYGPAHAVRPDAIHIENYTATGHIVLSANAGDILYAGYNGTARVGIKKADPDAALHVVSNYTGGSGDYTDVVDAPLKIETTSGYPRLPIISAHGSISAVYQYEDFKTVYWGESTDTGYYVFRGRNFNIPDGALYVSDDTNTLAYIGRAVIGGHSSAHDNLWVSHRDVAGTLGSVAMRQTAAGRTILNSASGEGLYFRINNVTQMLLDATGNLAVGGSSVESGYKLDVIGYATNSGMKIGSGTYDPTRDGMVVLTDSAYPAKAMPVYYYALYDALVVTNVTSNTETLFKVTPNGTPATAGGAIQVYFTDWEASQINWEYVQLWTDLVNNVGWLSTNYGGSGTLRPLVITTGTVITNGIYISTSGQVGIGTTNPSSPSGVNKVLHIADGTHAGLVLEDTSLANGIWDLWSNGGNMYTRNHAAGVYLWAGDTSGNMSVGSASLPGSYKLDVFGSCHASSWATTSDRRFKKHVKLIPNALEKVRRMDGVVFQWTDHYHSTGRTPDKKNPEKVEFGFVAQQIEGIVPEVISTWSHGDVDDYRGVDYSRLVPVLVEAVKELADEIDRLKRGR